MLFTKKGDKQIKSFFILDSHSKDSEIDSSHELSMRSYFRMKKYLVIFIGSLLSIGLQGCGSEPSLDEIKKKIVKVETPKGKYTTVNKSSGAYGKYQIMPKLQNITPKNSKFLTQNGNILKIRIKSL